MGALREEYLTTGQVAKACKVAPRTASKWIDSGMLRGWRIPTASGDRRVMRRDLLAMMREHHIPIPVWLGGGEVLTVAANGLGGRLRAALPTDMVLVETDDGFGAGQVFDSAVVRAVILDVGSLGTSEAAALASAICRQGRPRHLVALLPEGTGAALTPLEWGCTAVLEYPFAAETLAALIAE